MPDSIIFKATYSGIPVYEMMCKGVAVMRRRSDSWLNATQILKVAGFDKPQRTRILEREVQKGEHEKVQGGYGKYQGTWIPIHRGLELARQYNCEAALQPLIDFVPADKSPPLAPKHLISTSTKAPRKDAAGSAGISTRSSRRHPSESVEEENDGETASVRPSEDGSMTPSPSEASSSSRTPSPIHSPGPYHDTHGRHHSTSSRKSRRTHERYPDAEVDHEYEDSRGQDSAFYAEQVLEYFISDANQIPAFLISPPPDFDPNMAIDDDGHTALHWAAAMGRVRIVKLLLTAGADIFKVNNAGQTALMRSVMFANNYDVRKFPELYELLHRSTLNIDHHNRTVFHHIVDVAMTKGKSHAARYYMETVLARLSDYPTELADVVNFQDEDGETALTLAARCRSKRLVKLLIDVGANPKIANQDGKSAEDYILEDERFRMSPVPAARTEHVNYRNNHPNLANGGGNAPASWSYAPSSSSDKPPIHYSVSAQRASTKAVNEMATVFDGLAAAFDKELREKERDRTQAHALLGNIQAEILESQRAVAHLKQQAYGLTPAVQTMRGLEEELRVKMGRRYRMGWEMWIKDEEQRERDARGRGLGGSSHPPHSASAGFNPTMPGYALPPRTEDSGLSSHQPGAQEDEVSKGKRKMPPLDEDDARDLAELHSNIPADPVVLKAACDDLRKDIISSRARRKDAFDTAVSLQAEAGTHGRMSEYRRLIGAGCGGVPPGQVDSFVGTLLEALEQEEPASSSSLSWIGNAPAARPITSA